VVFGSGIAAKRSDEMEQVLVEQRVAE